MASKKNIQSFFLIFHVKQKEEKINKGYDTIKYKKNPNHKIKKREIWMNKKKKLREEH